MAKFKIFSASWCPNCVTLKKSFDDNNIPYEVVDCDTDEGMTEASAAGVRGLPVTHIIANGEVIRQVVGLQPIAVFLPHAEKLALEEAV